MASLRQGADPTREPKFVALPLLVTIPLSCRMEEMSRRVLLASGSPRRKELLAQICPEFDVCVADVNEELMVGEDAKEAAIRLAEEKAHAVFVQNQNAIVIGADTVVIVDNIIFGKPLDNADAFSMLKKLSGKTHQVVTGVAVFFSESHESFCEVTHVTFRKLEDSEIIEYIATGEPMDKAGAYAIQGGAANFVEKIDGEFENVVGLPLKKLRGNLGRLC